VVEYVALAVIILGLMFFLLEFSSRLTENKPTDVTGSDPISWFKMAYIFGAFLLGLALMGLGYFIATENSASAGIVSVFTAGLWFWASLTIITVFGLLIYFIYLIPKWLRIAAGIKEKENEDRDYE